MERYAYFMNWRSVFKQTEVSTSVVRLATGTWRLYQPFSFDLVCFHGHETRLMWSILLQVCVRLYTEIPWTETTNLHKPQNGEGFLYVRSFLIYDFYLASIVEHSKKLTDQEDQELPSVKKQMEYLLQQLSKRPAGAFSRSLHLSLFTVSTHPFVQSSVWGDEHAVSEL